MIRNQVLSEELTVTREDNLSSLVGRARTGDATAFTRLYRLHVNQVFAFTARRLADRDAAEEATQEIFTRALEGLHRCKSDEAFSGWLFGIARHVVDGHFKTIRSKGQTLESIAEPIDLALGPEDRAINAAAADELRKAREWCLSDADRMLFDLVLAELNDKQIAAALSRRPVTIRTARWRLLTKLRGCLTMLPHRNEAPHAPV